MKEAYTHSDQEMWSVAREVLYSLKGQNVILLKGELGAGKTTFAQGVLRALEAEGPFTSPTFVIMKKYDLKKQDFQAAYHIDCYRVGSIDLQELGWEEIIKDPNNLVLVEWPEMIIDIIPSQHVLVEIEILDKIRRLLKITDNRQ